MHTYLFLHSIFCSSIAVYLKTLRLQKKLKTHFLPAFVFLFRWNHPSEPGGQEKEVSAPSEGQSNSVPTSPAANEQMKKWLSSLLRHPPASGVRTESPGLTWARLVEVLQIKRRAKRSRGHGHSRGGKNHPQHAQLKRVGCVLGTCQVQNLSHRLYQLIGQNGREESSPINPRSPHSFG